MNPFLKDILTIGFSIGSLLISLISLVFGILNYRRQGGMLKCSLNYEKRNAVGVFLLKVENKGYHSIKINQIDMIIRKKDFPVNQEGFDLEYGESREIKISFAGYKNFHPLEVDRIEIKDIAGKIYKISTKSLRAKIRH